MERDCGLRACGRKETVTVEEALYFMNGDKKKCNVGGKWARNLVLSSENRVGKDGTGKRPRGESPDSHFLSTEK